MDEIFDRYEERFGFVPIEAIRSYTDDQLKEAMEKALASGIPISTGDDRERDV